jgi:anti-sigma factor RsiW
MTHLDLEIEMLAEGERDPTPEERAHLAACEPCARALALASDVQRLLSRQATPDVPLQFVAATLAKVRRARWRAEQRLDLAFNVALGLAVVLAVGALWIVLSATGLSNLSANVAIVFVETVNEAVRRSLPVLPMYTLGAGILVSGLAMWWWAEHGFEL